MAELLWDSLEACAEADLDITDEVYRRFFAVDLAAAELMGHSDQGMRGRMLQEVIELLIAGDDGVYLSWEVNNHLLSYDVDVAMYTNFFVALQATVSAALGERWTPAHERAWGDRVSSLLAEIKVLAAAAIEA